MTKPQQHKDWASLTDKGILQAVASWNWLNAFFAKYNGTGVTPLSGKMSRLMQSLTIVRHSVIPPKLYASMGNYTYAAIGLGLREFEINGAAHFTFHAKENLEFLYIVDPTNWHVIPYVATRLAAEGIVMKQSEEPVPLIQHTLRQPQHSLNAQEIQDIVKLLEIETEESAADQVNLSDCSNQFLALAKHFCGAANAEEVHTEVSKYEKSYKEKPEDLDKKLLADPLCEVVYDNMDGEDKGEFKEIGEAQVKSRIRARSSPWAMADDLNPRPKKAPKKHYFGPRRGGGRPRGSGKAQAIPPAPVADGAQSDDIIAAVDPIPLADLAPQEVASVPEVQPEGVASEALPAARARGRPRQRQTPAPAESGPDTQSQAPADAELAPADLQNQLEDHAIPSHPRGPDIRNATQWEEITCICGLPAGRKKFTNSPGNRDHPSWKISVRDNNKGTYASKGQGFTCRTEEACLTEAENQGVSLEDHIKNWVLERKQCDCTPPSPSSSPSWD